MIADFGEYLIFGDESGDHGLISIDPEFPVFALAFCLIRKEDYVAKIVPSIQRLKLDFWGHDQVILREHNIRKEKGPFGLLRTNKVLRGDFMQQLTRIVEEAPMEIIAAIIRKKDLKNKYAFPFNPYEIALLFCMERALIKLREKGQSGKKTHILVESRGGKEDADLELEFRRICDNKGNWGYRKPDFSQISLELLFIDKKSNSSGLQLADLVARPIALQSLRPKQPNRAYDIIRTKNLLVKMFP